MSHDQRIYGVALVGCGNLGLHVARGISAGAAGPYRLTAAFDALAIQQAKQIAGETAAVFCATLDELLETRPEYVVETASANALKEIAIPCLRGGAHLVILSTGALAQDSFLNELIQTAREHGKKIYIASGAIGGLDLAQAALLAGDLQVTMTTAKPPRALEGAPGLEGKALAEPSGEKRVIFRGPAREAIQKFPQNVNVVASLSFATTGLDQVAIAIASDPSLTRNRHTVSLEGRFGKATVEVEANPSPDNPRSSLLAAYSVLALLKKLQSPIQIG